MPNEKAEAVVDTSDAGLAAAHAELRGDASLQLDFPTLIPPKPPAWLTDFLHLFDGLGDALSFLGPAVRYIFWGIVIVGVAIILTLIFLEVRGVAWRWPWKKKPVVIEEVNWQPDAKVAVALLSDADRLAAEGRYAEAAHLLLQRSIDDIGTRLPGFIQPSLTSRDIAKATTLPERARTTFSGIAHVVEVSLFGRVGVDSEMWQRCRSSYEDFAFAGSWA